MIVSLPLGVSVDAETVKHVHVRSEASSGRPAAPFSVVVRTEEGRHVVAACATREEAEAMVAACWRSVNEVLERRDLGPERHPWPTAAALRSRQARAEEGPASAERTPAATRGPAAAPPPEPGPLDDAAPSTWSEAWRSAVAAAGRSLVAEGRELLVGELRALCTANPEDPSWVVRRLLANPDLGAATAAGRSAWAAAVGDELMRWRIGEPEPVGRGPSTGSAQLDALAADLGEPPTRLAVTWGLRPPREAPAPDPAFRAASPMAWPPPWPAAAVEPEAVLRGAAAGWAIWYRQVAKAGLAPAVDGHVGNQLAMWTRAINELGSRDPVRRLRRARGIGQAVGWVALACDALLANEPHEVVAERAATLRGAALEAARGVLGAERDLPIELPEGRVVGRLWTTFREGLQAARREGALLAVDTGGAEVPFEAALRAFDAAFSEAVAVGSGADLPDLAAAVGSTSVLLRRAVGRNRMLDGWIADLSARVALRAEAWSRRADLPPWSLTFDEARHLGAAGWSEVFEALRATGFARCDLPATTAPALDALVAARQRLLHLLDPSWPVFPRSRRPVTPRSLEAITVQRASDEVARCAARVAPTLEALAAAAVEPGGRAFCEQLVDGVRGLGAPIEPGGAVKATVGRLA